MENKILNLSKTYNSLEISRILDISLNTIEKVLIDKYYNNNWKVSKTDLLKIASKIYYTSPIILSREFNIFEPTLKNTTLTKANKNGDDRCLQVTWSKSDSIYVLNTLYENATIYLNRKYKRYLFFKNNNFAVFKSDFKDNDRAISVKAKQFINSNYNINIDELLQANTEIIT